LLPSEVLVSRPTIVILALVLGAGAAFITPALGVEVRSLLLSDAPPAGVAPGIELTGINFLSANDRGEAVVYSFLEGDGVTPLSDAMLLSVGTRGTSPLLREGEPIAGLPTGTTFIAQVSNAVHNNAGQTAISAYLAGEGVTGANQRAILIGSPAGFRSVVRLGDTLNFNGQDYEVGWLDNRVVLNDSGQAAFLAALRTPGSSGDGAYAPLLYSGGALHLIAKDGDQLAPQLPGREFTAINPPLLNSRGDVVFWSHTVEFVGGFPNEWSGVFRHRDGQTQAVALTDDPYPGSNDGVEFANVFLRINGLNDAGDVAFLADLRGPGVVGGNYRGLFTGEPGDLRQIARSGDRAPGTAGNTTFRNFYEPVINGAGMAAFVGFLQGTGVNVDNEDALYVETAAGLRLVARTGNRAPGTPSGVVFDSLSGTPSINTMGMVAFSATLRGPGLTSDNRLGLYATDAEGVLTLIARHGDPFDVDDDPDREDWRIVDRYSAVGGSGGEDGLRVALNDLGQLFFTLTFTDGTSGAFYAQLAPIPEPAALSIALAAIVAFAGRRRERLSIDSL
jgi:hypothetical protein